MPRECDPDKVFVRTIKARQANGDIYVYERRSRYDPQRGFEVPIGKKLMGVIRKGATEMTPTRPKRPAGRKGAEPVAEASQMGLSELLAWIGRESGIDDDVRQAFGGDRADADRLISIARYSAARSDHPAALLSTWQVSHAVPCGEPIDENAVHDLYRHVGAHAGIAQQYFKRRAARMPDGDCTVFDSTTMSTDSEQQPEARQGFNKAGDGKDTIKCAAFLSMKTRQPIAFAKEPGNIPDVLAIGAAIKSLSFLGLKARLIVTDNGYTSEANMAALCRSGCHFLTMCRAGTGWIKAEVEPRAAELLSPDSLLRFEDKIRGITIKARHRFTWKEKYNTKNHKAGEEIEHEYTLWIHAYVSNDTFNRDWNRLESRIALLKQQVEEGVEDFTPAAKGLIKRFLTVTEVKEGKHAAVNNDEYQKALKYCGVFAIVSNTVGDCAEALRIYRRREEIEACFRLGKQRGGLAHPRVWTPEVLEGRLFAMFVTLGYVTFLQERMRAAKAVLGKPNGDPKHDLKASLDAESKLRIWMENISLDGIMEWFDCVREVTAKTKAGKVRWSTALIDRDRRFLKAIGYPVRDSPRGF